MKIIDDLFFNFTNLFYLTIDFLVFILVLVIIILIIKLFSNLVISLGNAFLDLKIKEKNSKIVFPIDGNLPIPISELNNINYNRLYEIYILSKMGHQNMPHTIHYAPNIQNNGKVEEKLCNQIGFNVPSYADLINNNRIGIGDYLIGFKPNGEEVRLEQKNLFSLAIGGQSGTGKTNTMTWLLLQAKLNGAKIIVIDPHNNINLANIADVVASEDVEIESVCKDIIAIGENRLKSKQKQNFEPIAIAIDEVIALVNYSESSKSVKELLDKCANQFRKVNIAVIASSQDWKASRLGGDNSIRTQFTNRLAHKMESRQAKLLIDSEDNKKIPHLGEGQAIFSDRFGNTNMIDIPFVENVIEVTDTKIKLSEDDKQIISLFAQGKNKMEITKEIYGKYTPELSKQVDETIRKIIKENIL